jgi:hypothetical protein
LRQLRKAQATRTWELLSAALPISSLKTGAADASGQPHPFELRLAAFICHAREIGFLHIEAETKAVVLPA